MSSTMPPTETPRVGMVPLRLLQVEHEPGDVELCIRELKKSGLEFHAETVATREQFVQKLLVQSFDIIIADYRLPGWTGMDALAEMKNLGLNIPVILVTGALGTASQSNRSSKESRSMY